MDIKSLVRDADYVFSTLKELEDENRRLKKMYSDLALDNDNLREVIEKKL